MDTLEIIVLRLNAQEVFNAPKRFKHDIPNRGWNRQFVWKRSWSPRESSLRRDQLARSEDLSGELQGEPEKSQPRETRDDAENRNDFWSIEGDFISRHHIEPRVQRYVPKEETFAIPLKYVLT